MKTLTPAQFLRETRNLRNKFDTEIFRAKQDISQYAVSHFKSSFDRGGFAGTRGKWAERLRDYPHQIMDKSGALKNSITSSMLGSKIRIETKNGYSQYHNDPTGTWLRNQHSNKPATQRQFIGNSNQLEQWVLKRLQRALTNTFR